MKKKIILLCSLAMLLTNICFANMQESITITNFDGTRETYFKNASDGKFYSNNGSLEIIGNSLKNTVIFYDGQGQKTGTMETNAYKGTQTRYDSNGQLEGTIKSDSSGNVHYYDKYGNKIK